MTRLQERDIRRDADRLQRRFDEAGRNAGQGFGSNLADGIGQSAPKAERSLLRVEKATDKVADAMGNVRREQAKYDELIRAGEKDRTKLITHSERLAKAKRVEASAIREASRAHLDLQHSVQLMGSLADSADGASKSAQGLGKSLGSVGASGPVGLAVVTVAIGAIAEAAVAATASVAALAQSVLVLPAALGGAAAGFGTLKLATMGFAEAMDSIRDPKEFAKALQQLSPNAQQAALTLQNLVPQFDALKNATQDAFFSGMGEQINRLVNQFGPTIQQTTTGIAAAFNQAFSGVADQLMTPETQAALGQFATNTVAAFQELSKAAAPFTEAFAQLMATGSKFLPQIAGWVTKAAEGFAAFVANAQANGDLERWMAGGLRALEQVGTLVMNVGSAFMRLAPVGEQLLPLVVEGLSRAANGLATLMEYDGEHLVTLLKMAFTSADALAKGFGFAKSAVEALGDTVRNVMNGIATAINNSALAPIRNMIDALNAVNKVTGKPQIPQIGIPMIPEPGPAMQKAAPGTGLGGMAPRPQAGLPTMGLGGWSPFGVPAAPADGSTTSLPDAPVLPYDSALPPGLAGMPQDASVFSAESSFLDARHKLAEKRARVAQLEQDANATDQDVLNARNDVTEAERDLQAAEMRMGEARASQYDKLTKQTQKQVNDLGELGASIDQDFGISKGLAGIAENITKFVANLAAAPLLGQLDAITKANPSQGGYGALGIAAARGAFGPDYTGIAPQGTGSGGGYSSASAATYGSSGSSSGGAYSPGAPKSGESARAFAHRVMKPYFEAQGLTVGDHAADQYGEHQNGALDIMVPDIASGDAVLQQVLADPNTYGAIFNNQAYGYGQGSAPRPYGGGFTGNPTQDHKDHVHAWYKPGGKNNITPGGAGTGGGAPGFGRGGPPMSAPFGQNATRIGGVEPANGVGKGGIGIDGGGGVPSLGTSSGVVPVYVTNMAAMIAPTVASGVPTGAAPVADATGVPTTPLPGAVHQGTGAAPGPVTGGGGAGGAAAFGPGGPPMTRIGGLAPAAGTGSGGIGMTGGGALDTAISAGAAGLDMLAPGAGQAAATGSKLVNRAIEYGGQVAGIGVQGAMETFLPTGGSELANNNWLTRIVGGIAGAAPALPNLAGKSPAAEDVSGIDPAAAAQGQIVQKGGDTTINVTNQRANEDGTGRDIAYHQMAANAGPGM